jgi:hypothetical protein
VDQSLLQFALKPVEKVLEVPLCDDAVQHFPERLRFVMLRRLHQPHASLDVILVAMKSRGKSVKRFWQRFFI